MYDVIIGIITTRDISKLSQISFAQRLVKLRITISKYHEWYLCQISLQIMLLPIQIAPQSIFRTINRGLSAVQKISKITYTAFRFSLLTNLQCELWLSVWMNINRNTFWHNIAFIIFIFLFNGFSTMCTVNLKKRLISAPFGILLQAMFMNDWKQTTQRLKLQERYDY